MKVTFSNNVENYHNQQHHLEYIDRYFRYNLQYVFFVPLFELLSNNFHFLSLESIVD